MNGNSPREIYRLLFPTDGMNEEQLAHYEDEKRGKERRRSARDYLRANFRERRMRWQARTRLELEEELERLLSVLRILSPLRARRLGGASEYTQTQLVDLICDLQKDHVLCIIELGADADEVAAELARASLES